MLEEITAQDWHFWLAMWEVEPWGDLRADQRAAAQALWNTAPYAGENADLPNLTFPYWVDEMAEIDARIAALEKRAKEIRENGCLNRKTSDPPND